MSNVSHGVQCTLATDSPSLSGVAIHTGSKVNLRFKPAPVDFGIKFKRLDLPDEPLIEAKIENVTTLDRATTIAEGPVKVQTVEHALSALYGMGIDNAIIEMDANEPPIGDGSAMPFVQLINRAGTLQQDAPQKVYEVREPVTIEIKKTGAFLAILPDDKFRISCTQVGPNPKFTQFKSFELTPDAFETEIASARTFTFYEEIQPLIDQGLIKGGSLENAVVIRGDAVLSKEPLRYPDEFVRHKILDIIGDLSLFGRRIKGHVIAIKPGHRANAELTRALQKQQSQLAALVPLAPMPVRDTALDIGEVMRLLPHRYPFLMVDRVVSFGSENQCTAIKQVTANEEYFQGHFPGFPVMPGVLQVEAMAQVASILLLRQPEHTGKLGYFMSADNVKFRKPVVPGDTLFIHAELQKARRNVVKAVCHCSVNDAIVSEAEIMLSMFSR